VLAIGVSWCALTTGGNLPADIAAALLVPGAVLTLTGLVDDLRGVSAGLRLCVQVLATLPMLVLLPFGLFAGAVVGFLWVWMINLYNFMDGIDGMAAWQGILAAGGAAALMLLDGRDAGMWAPAAAVATACLGFLLLNRPPARVFMGDAGSAFLGYVFGGLALYTGVSGVLSPMIWLILLGVFIVDATVTLALRIWRRERWWVAHRQHAYQRLAAGRWGHGGTIARFAVVSLLWLWPLALVAHWWPALAPAVAPVALLPLAGGVLWLDARSPGAGELAS